MSDALLAVSMAEDAYERGRAEGAAAERERIAAALEDASFAFDALSASTREGRADAETKSALLDNLAAGLRAGTWPDGPKGEP